MLLLLSRARPQRVAGKRSNWLIVVAAAAAGIAQVGRIAAAAAAASVVLVSRSLSFVAARCGRAQMWITQRRPADQPAG